MGPQSVLQSGNKQKIKLHKKGGPSFKSILFFMAQIENNSTFVLNELINEKQTRKS